MSKVERLAQSYGRYISIPWRDDTSAAQRVIFCVYDPADELRMRAKIGEFEIATKQAGHAWATFDLTDTFAAWLGSQRYARSYFKQPALLTTLLPKYLEHIEARFDVFLGGLGPTHNLVVALYGVGSLFGFIKVKEVIDKLAPRVRGRLVVFFPGSHEDNNYRLLDGYDGWNYLAVAITADNQM